MWMPDYYFDTLVSLELFNQWFFQPAKVLALSSLTKNSGYILPYQILAYANFLTNSRDTSIEYLKKLVDLDPNNAEKYQFLMWVAYYSPITCGNDIHCTQGNTLLNIFVI